MRNNIPMELRSLPQWVCAGPDKIPLNPRTGQPASVTDPNTWASFEEAIRTGMKHTGFVLTGWDPYTIIDLDNKPQNPCTPEQWARHQKILESFVSYTERSASGTGYHVIIKGKLPAGVHRDNVEVYSTGRYMICTGDVVRNSPIEEYQPLLDILYGEMQPQATVELQNIQSNVSDEDIVNMASRAANGDKFNQLCVGNWQAMMYPSQSEADFALLSILAYYTMDNEQVRRIFRMTGLGKRDKAIRNDKYLNFALQKVRAHQPPPVDIEALKVTIPQPSVEPESTPIIPGVSLPPGLVGEIAQYIYNTAIRPVPEIALTAAIAFTSGICARSYNVSGSGLNQYLIILAKTGAGKEGAVTGIDNLMTAIRPSVPMIDQFIGPSAFASGQALIKTLDSRPCFVSILGEFGLTLQQLCDPRANNAEKMIKKVLLDLYSKSGWNKILRPSVYADSDKNTKMIQAPNVTILGESTPESFFNGLDTSHISEGLIPRFAVIEYTGPRPPRNRNANQPPDKSLVQQVSDLAAISLTMANNGTCANIQMNQGAIQLMDDFDSKADRLINESSTSVDMQLWNRAHLKALKLAGVIAVGCNPHNPIVTEEIARWAIEFTEKEVSGMATRFHSGEIGAGDHRHELDIRRAVEQYLGMPADKRLQYKVPKSMLEEPVVPFHYLRRKLRLLTAFKNDRRGAARALDESLKDMVEAEVLRLVPVQQALEKYGVTSRLFVVGSTW